MILCELDRCTSNDPSRNRWKGRLPSPGYSATVARVLLGSGL